MTRENAPFIRPLFVAAIISLVAATSCSNDVESTVRVIKPSRTGVAMAAQGPVDRAGGSVLGIRRVGPSIRYLIDSEGRAVYMFTPDADSESSACNDECARVWPPVISSGEPTAVEPAVDEDLISTISRDDGQQQLTYDQWPLYNYSGDSEAGDTSGHGIESFQGEWYLISPEGTPIREKLGAY